MPFDNPYVAQSFDIGDITAGHMHFDSAGTIWYAPDGVTQNLVYSSATGLITIAGSLLLSTTSGAAPSISISSATNEIILTAADGTTLTLNPNATIDAFTGAALSILPATGVNPNFQIPAYLNVLYDNIAETGLLQLFGPSYDFTGSKFASLSLSSGTPGAISADAQAVLDVLGSTLTLSVGTLTVSGATVVLDGNEVSADQMRFQQGIVLTSETTASAVYANLATVGPQATVKVPPSGAIKITLSAQMSNNTAGANSLASVLVQDADNGFATVFTPSDSESLVVQSALANGGYRSSLTFVLGGLTVGHHMLTSMQYRVTSNTGAYSRRILVVEPCI